MTITTRILRVETAELLFLHVAEVPVRVSEELHLHEALDRAIVETMVALEKAFR